MLCFFGSTVSDILFEEQHPLSHLAPLVNLLSKHDVGMGKESHAPPVTGVLLPGVLMLVFFLKKTKISAGRQ